MPEGRWSEQRQPLSELIPYDLLRLSVIEGYSLGFQFRGLGQLDDVYRTLKKARQDRVTSQKGWDHPDI